MNMDKDIEAVQKHYDEEPLIEWNRLQKDHPYEKYITLKVMDRYVKPGDRILDIGGGPGHYSINYAKKGNDVTLLDLSCENIRFARRKASANKCRLNAITGNALDLSAFEDGSFDIVFLMGPIYHLMQEEDRVKALTEAARVLISGGYLFTSFILMNGGAIYDLREAPNEIVRDEKFLDIVTKDGSLAFSAFTKAYMSSISDSEKLLCSIDSLETVTEFAQEGVLAPYMHNLEKLGKKERELWYEFSYKMCEKKEYLSHGEHLMIVSRKKS